MLLSSILITFNNSANISIMSSMYIFDYISMYAYLLPISLLTSRHGWDTDWTWIIVFSYMICIISIIQLVGTPTGWELLNRHHRLVLCSSYLLNQIQGTSTALWFSKWVFIYVCVLCDVLRLSLTNWSTISILRDSKMYPCNKPRCHTLPSVSSFWLRQPPWMHTVLNSSR